MSSKEKLLQLEKTGQHVFHGSPDGDIQSLEPRQAKHSPDLDGTSAPIPDGVPSVSATPHSEIATFRAIINGKNIPFDHDSGFGIVDGEKTFSVSSERVLAEAKGKNGYVYVFDKKDFKPYDRNGNPRPDSMEWRSDTTVKPLDVIEVTSDDLPVSDKIVIDGESREQTSSIEIQPKGSYLKIDDEGYVINPASPEKIQEKWKPVISDVLQAYKVQYGDKLKGAYILGSVAKGEAIENISDIDTFAYVDLSKEEIDGAWTNPVEEKLKEIYPFVKGFEMGVFPISDTETDEDQIFLLQSLCVYGDKIELRKRKPGKDMIFHFPITKKRMLGFENRIDTATSEEKMKIYCTWMMKNILRTGFELTMERSHKYTRDLYLCYKDFSDYYPEFEPKMKEVLFLALNPTTDKEKIRVTMLAIVPWMIEECVKQV